MLTNIGAEQAEIVDVVSGKTVLTVPVSSQKIDANSGDSISTIIFDQLDTPGEYYVQIPEIGRSYSFKIGNDVYEST